MKQKFNHSEQANITHKRGVNNLKIYVSEILHLDIKLDSFIGLQSWYANKNDCKIELYFKDRIIVLEYNSVDKWKRILKLLDENI